MSSFGRALATASGLNEPTVLVPVETPQTALAAAPSTSVASHVGQRCSPAGSEVPITRRLLPVFLVVAIVEAAQGR